MYVILSNTILLCYKIFFMPFFRNFTYWIDKRRWKYCFLLTSLAMDSVNVKY